MNVSYVEFEADDEEVIIVEEFLEKIFPDKSLLRYFKDIASDVFVGGNHQKKVYFFLGNGDNGKSVLQKLMELMLGPLAIKFDTNLITGQKPGSGSAHAELARAGGGVRWATLEEPNKEEKINSGVLKKLSGNDSYWARDLFEKGKETKEIVPLFKIIFIANKLPHIKYTDKAVWNRIRVLLFETTFCRPGDADNVAPETYEEQLRKKMFPMGPRPGEETSGHDRSLCVATSPAQADNILEDRTGKGYDGHQRVQEAGRFVQAIHRGAYQRRGGRENHAGHTLRYLQVLVQRISAWVSGTSRARTCKNTSKMCGEVATLPRNSGQGSA